jgi:hypothetical protein
VVEPPYRRHQASARRAETDVCHRRKEGAAVGSLSQSGYPYLLPMELFDPRHLLPLIIIGGSFTFAGSILYGAWLLGRYRGRDEQGYAVLADVEHRLQRLEDTVSRASDSLDRLEAAHRLTARLITDRASGSDSRSAQRPATPH